MTIKVIKTVEVEEQLNLGDLRVVRYSQRDVDSTHIVVYYKDDEIGCGHINDRTNFAHIDLMEELFSGESASSLEEFLVDGIENRTIELN